MVTYPGTSMGSRVSASFANANGFKDEMVVNSWEEYEKRALELYNNRDIYKVRVQLPEKLCKTTDSIPFLQDLRARWESKIKTGPLFDTKRWVGNVEKAFDMVWEIYLNGEQPRNIFVKDNGA